LEQVSEGYWTAIIAQEPLLILLDYLLSGSISPNLIGVTELTGTTNIDRTHGHPMSSLIQHFSHALYTSLTLTLCDAAEGGVYHRSN
jgi:hypothetical protein